MRHTLSVCECSRLGEVRPRLEPVLSVTSICAQTPEGLITIVELLLFHSITLSKQVLLSLMVKGLQSAWWADHVDNAENYAVRQRMNRIVGVMARHIICE